MKSPHHDRCCRAAALAIVLCVLALVSAITAGVFAVVTNRARSIHQSSAWQEALLASEAGVHQAMAQLESGLKANALPEGEQTFQLHLAHGGETSDLATVEYTLRRNQVTHSDTLRPYFSIVSTGTVRLPGNSSLSGEKQDIALRKLDVTRGFARRTIEAWAKPATSTDLALKVNEELVLNNHRVAIDSFDSNDPGRSLPGGQPSKTIGQFNVAPHHIYKAHIATNSEFIAGGNASVYGDALTNGGTVGDAGGILGEVRDDHYEALAPVYPPAWVATTPAGVPTPDGVATTVRQATTVRGGTITNPRRYVVDAVSLAGGKDTLTFDFGLASSGAPDPARNHVELFVRGDFETKGAGGAESILIVKGMKVQVWFGGDVHLAGNAVSNGSGLAGNLALYGVNAPKPRPDQTVTIGGNATFYGTVYAPSADLHLAGGGSKGTFVGSLVGKNAYLKGHAEIRYDEALGGLGMITGFKLVSWFEDTKPVGSFAGKL